LNIHDGVTKVYLTKQIPIMLYCRKSVLLETVEREMTKNNTWQLSASRNPSSMILIGCCFPPSSSWSQTQNKYSIWCFR